MVPDLIPMTLLLFSFAAIAYHHIGYPKLVSYLARSKNGLQPAAESDTATPPASLPTVTIIVPAYNEAAVIAAKIENIASLDYPRDRLSVMIALDGCTDATGEIVKEAIARHGAGLDIRVIEYPENIGKIAVLNDCIANVASGVVALSDASALVDPDALRKAARQFRQEAVGVVCATYRLAAAGSEGESAYWKYQTELKACEAALAAPMGAHGAFYMFRRCLWQPMPPDTINDDFILPMQIVLNGSRAVYDPTIVATEIERTSSEQEFRRRVRIGAGNMQQIIRLAKLADPRRGWLAFLFVSGKGVRPIVPFLAIISVLATAWLALRWGGAFTLLLAAELGAVALASTFFMSKSAAQPRAMKMLGYLFAGHFASLIGAVRFLVGLEQRPWGAAKRAAPRAAINEPDYMPRAVIWGKRTLDCVLTVIAMPVLAILFVPIALAIKLESPGPIFYRQLRVGRADPRGTHTFELIKFRSMRADAEATTGPVWAAKNDPRVTRVGRFLRKTRFDELPQFINVLKGDMSVIGPRPERPTIVTKLEEAIPFYSERTFWVRPGITGLAQVNQRYDTSLGDVRSKTAYDHAYAAHLGNVRDWLAIDLRVLAKTALIVLRAEGQ